MNTPRKWALSSATIGLATTVLYVALIVGEGDNSPLAVAPWALLMSTAVGSAFYGAFGANAPWVHRGLQVSIVIFGVIGILGIFTIGIPFLVAALCATIALTRMLRSSAPPTQT